MDCNSIIYDSVSVLEKIIPKLDIVDFEIRLIKMTIEKIEEYIHIINPSETVYIAFDGVAPPAKHSQQLERRFKNTFMNEIRYGDETDETLPIFDKCKITPGTNFMNKLSEITEEYFKDSNKKYKVKNLILSTPKEPGEGEQKLFEYVRVNSNTIINSDIAIYGLDSDLFMLSIFHLKYVNNIFIFREAPEFLKTSIPSDIFVNENEPYFIDMNMLTKYLLEGMNCKYTHSNRLNDYVLLCFLLGNDFLPHFQALNIRTNGINVLLDVYREHFGNYDGKYLISEESEEIIWDNFFLLIKELGKIEYKLLLKEYSYRNKYDKFHFKETTPNEKREIIQNIPIIYRAVEKYICPEEKFWKERYYKALVFDWKPVSEKEKKEKLKEISSNFFEGIERVYKYYKLGEIGEWSHSGKSILLYDLELCKCKYKEECKYKKEECKKRIEEWEWSVKRYIWESKCKV